MRPKNKKNILFVIDAGPSIGMGHLMRESVLAQFFRSKGYASFFLVRSKKIKLPCSLSPLLFGHLSDARPASWAAAQKPIGIIVDTMHVLPEKEVRALKALSAPMAVIGNYPEPPRWAGLCINPYTQMSSHSARIKILSDPRYTILGREFENSRTKNGRRNIRKHARRIFVMPGGGNTGGIVFKILEAMQKLPPAVQIDLVVGSFFSKTQALKRALSSFHGRVQVHSQISSSRVLMLMKKADIAVLSYGRSMDEARSTGLPCLILSSNHLNDLGGRHAASLGGVLYGGNFLRVSSARVARSLTSLLQNWKLRARLSCEGMKLVDAHGRRRVAQALENYFLRGKA